MCAGATWASDQITHYHNLRSNRWQSKAILFMLIYTAHRLNRLAPQTADHRAEIIKRIHLRNQDTITAFVAFQENTTPLKRFWKNPDGRGYITRCECGSVIHTSRQFCPNQKCGRIIPYPHHEQEMAMEEAATIKRKESK